MYVATASKLGQVREVPKSSASAMNELLRETNDRLGYLQVQISSKDHTSFLRRVQHIGM